MLPGSRKRTSVLAGWTLTSTSSPGRSMKSASTGWRSRGKQILIGGAHRADQQPVLHRAAVDEQILVIGDAAVEGRQTRDPAEPRRTALIVDRQAVRRQLAGRQRRDPRRAVLAWLNAQRAPPVMLQGEADIGPRHGEPLHHVEAGGIFAPLRAQELAPRRDLAEQLLDGDPRAGRQRGRPLPRQFAVVDDTRPAIGAAHPAFDRHPGDAGDRRQCLAAKAERGHLLDRLARQLRGRVPLQRQRDLVLRHAAAVVDDLDPVQPAGRKAHCDPGGTRVDRVLDQLFQRAGRSFHHFTRRDAVDEMLGQTAY